MPRLLMLSLVYGPDMVSTANMMTDLANGLQRRGHQVTVITSMPHFNVAPEVAQSSTFRGTWWRGTTERDENGVRVLRVYMPLKRPSLWLRARDYLWFHLVTLWVAMWHVSRQDIVFVPSPPITLGISGLLIALLKRSQLIYDVRELWPDVPIRMGLIRSKALITLVQAMERFVYQQSVAVTSIARTFMQQLAQRGVANTKLHFTPNFVDTDWMVPQPKDNSFSQEHGLVDKFVVFYAGNIGMTQGLEILVEVATALQEDKEIVLLVIGDGAGRPDFERAVLQAGLNNIRVMGFQPYSRIPETYATADICISPMRFGFSHDTVPSKIYTAMAAARPVIAACEPMTETAQLLLESRGGLAITPESVQEMIQAIRQLRAYPMLAQEMGEQARQWVVYHYSKEAVVAAYDDVITQVTTAMPSSSVHVVK